jgi:hypothetical protein
MASLGQFERTGGISRFLLASLGPGSSPCGGTDLCVDHDDRAVAGYMSRSSDALPPFRASISRRKLKVLPCLEKGEDGQEEDECG